MPSKTLPIYRVTGGRRFPEKSAVLILLQSWEELEPTTLHVLAPGRNMTVFLYQPVLAEVARVLEDGNVAVIRADAQESASPGMGGLNPIAVALLSRKIEFYYLPAIAQPDEKIVHLGPPVLRAETSVERLRLALYDLSERAFRLPVRLGNHLGYECLRGLKKNWFHPVFIDGFQNDRPLPGGKLAAAAWELSTWLRAQVPEKRVGIVLPAGLGAAVANLACVLADKTPVNFNFTAGRALNEIALQRSGVGTLITAEAMKSKAKDFPWPAKTVDLKELLGAVPKWRLTLRWLAGLLLPSTLLRLLVGVPKEGGDQEAGLLFTSGSVGEPKGVVLTHRNILGNTAQTDVMLSGIPIKNMLACLPIFHSFGCTVTFWWPILGGPAAVTYVSPMETAKLIELIEKHQVGLLLNTATFLRNFLRKAEPQQLRSLKLIVAGAEKLPRDLADDLEQKFNVAVCEGFGMTEATPVVSCNLVDFRRPTHEPAYEAPRRKGSVGRLIPGLSVRIRNPETGAPQPLNQTGMIWLKGINIFPGYLGDAARTAQVLKDGWYQTGDLGRLDDDGFLFIEGRLTRFSKLAGEMVPHGTVEEAVIAAFPELGEEFQPVIIGVDDAGKGEALILLSPAPLDLQVLRARLAERGLPNLWIPRQIRLVPEIPRLATGKVDLGACRKLAETAAA